MKLSSSPTASIFTLTLFCVCSNAQVGGSISGVVKDPTGAVISTATIVVANTETDVSREV